MLAQLAAYMSAVLGEALAYELMVLLVFTLMISVRRILYRGLRWHRRQHEEPADRLRAALWKLLRRR